MNTDRTFDPAALSSAYLGKPVPRLEDEALLRGRGRFADDLGAKPGTLAAAVVRSSHAHAKLLGVDAAAATRMPGVRAVLTGADVRQWSAPFVVGVKQPMEHWCLAVDRVRSVGEPVAVVVAETRALAEDAADAVVASYEPLPCVVTIDDAVREGAPVLHPAVGSNVVSDRRFRYGDPEDRDEARRLRLRPLRQRRRGGGLSRGAGG